MLKTGGIFRIIVPSLEARVEKYIQNKDAHSFIQSLGCFKNDENDNFLKKLRSDGKDKITATIEACNVRARPIILTSITTFLGISPLIFFKD